MNSTLRKKLSILSCSLIALGSSKPLEVMAKPNWEVFQQFEGQHTEKELESITNTICNYITDMMKGRTQEEREALGKALDTINVMGDWKGVNEALWDKIATTVVPGKEKEHADVFHALVALGLYCPTKPAGPKVAPPPAQPSQPRRTPGKPSPSAPESDKPTEENPSGSGTGRIVVGVALGGFTAIGGTTAAVKLMRHNNKSRSSSKPKNAQQSKKTLSK